MNRLVPNSSKSKLMMFSSRPTQDLTELAFAYEVSGVPEGGGVLFEIAPRVSKMRGAPKCEI